MVCSDDWVYEEEVRDDGTSLGSLGILWKVSSFLASLMMVVGIEDVIGDEERASGVVSCGFLTGEVFSIFSSTILFYLF